MASGANEYQWDEVDVQLSDEDFELPSGFDSMPMPVEFRTRLQAGARREEFDKCRFIRYRPHFFSAGSPGRLILEIGRTNYLDYLRSGEHLDRRIPGQRVTFRDRYAAHVTAGPDLAALPLTNICGVGIFLVTPDHKVIVMEHSRHVSVHAGSMSYSASGTMDWNLEDTPFVGEARGNDAWSGFVHPFTQVSRECLEEIGHTPHPERLTLFGLGLDARRLYVQFSFFEWTTRSAEEIIRTASYARDFHLEISHLEAVDLDPVTVARVIRERQWEPCAEAALLSLCAREHGVEADEQALDPDFVRQRWRQQMRAEWSRRAALTGDLAVMSSRYPRARVQEASARYAKAVVDFAREAITEADVLDVGCGTGRLAEQLAGLAASYTAVDASPEMLGRAKDRVAATGRTVSFVQTFGQDYDGLHDVVIVSLVLIHNVDDHEFAELVHSISNAAERVLLFEHVDTPGLRHPHTRLRSEEELVGAFPEFAVHRRTHHDLLGDKVVFLDLVRAPVGVAPAPATTGSPDTATTPAAPAAQSAPPAAPAIRLFYSYAHRDTRFKVELDKHLSVLKRQGILSEWHDRMIPPGSEWAEQIDSQLRAAQVILLLISADFLASEYCMGIEVREALRMHASGATRVIPVIVRPCDWQADEFARLQALPTDGRAISSWKNRDDAFANVAIGIRTAVAELTGPAHR